MGFSDQLTRIAGKAQSKVERLVSESVREIAADGARNTPRQSGALRASIEVTAGPTPPPVLPTMNAEQRRAFAAERPNGDVSQADALAEQGQGRISWTQPYARLVEFGGNRQAGRLYATRTGENAAATIRRVAERLAAE